jgi:hypothetical protein
VLVEEAWVQREDPVAGAGLACAVARNARRRPRTRADLATMPRARAIRLQLRQRSAPLLTKFERGRPSAVTITRGKVVPRVYTQLESIAAAAGRGTAPFRARSSVRRSGAKCYPSGGRGLIPRPARGLPVIARKSRPLRFENTAERPRRSVEGLDRGQGYSASPSALAAEIRFSAGIPPAASWTRSRLPTWRSAGKTRTSCT